MIPLVVCQTDTSPWYVTAAAIVGFACALGVLSGHQLRALGAIKFYVLSLCLSALLPVLMYAGKWPFDPKWNYDCGATPDPNIWPIYATLAFPFVLALSAAGSRLFQLKL